VAIAAEAECIFNPAVDVVISRSETNGLRGGVVYQGYTGSSTEAHIAGWGPGWLSKDLLWIIFDYPFNQLSCTKVFLQIPTRNTKSLAFAAKLGFKEIARIDEVFPDCDMSIMSLSRKDCRWLDISCEAKRLMTSTGAENGQEK
jgi:L-amino acid N-acyltransferase YncA